MDADRFDAGPRFELRRKIGAGGFGVVYEAYDRERAASVALKTLNQEDSEGLYRFKQEFRALADIVHENLVQLHELASHEGRWFFTMELVDGANVIAFVREALSFDAAFATTIVVPSSQGSSDEGRSEPPGEPAPITVARAVDLGRDAAFVQDPDTEAEEEGAPPVRAPRAFDEHRLRDVLQKLALGLTALHDAGRLHRDIKPSNVLVDARGRLVLVDFGLATSFGERADLSLSTLAGTPGYMAPEQIKGGAPSPAWDWYAVGVLLYEALTGRLPFEGDMSIVMTRKLAVDPLPPSALVDDVPADLDALAMSLLARDPSARSAGREVLAALGAAPRSRRAARAISAFVGREHEQRTISDLLRGARRDRSPAIALISGPSGMGKTALAKRIRETLAASMPDAIVIAGRCYEQESVPYKAIDALVDPLSRHLRKMKTSDLAPLLPDDARALAKLFPVLDQVEAIADMPGLPGRADAHGRRRRAFAALRELFARLAERAPLALFIDDLQWGDAESGAVLTNLLLPPSPPPLLLVVTFRSEDRETSPCLATFLPALETLSVRRANVELGSLPEAQAIALAEALLAESGAGAELAASIARESGGRPFFVRELAMFSGDRAPMSLRGGARRASVASLDELVRARIADLPDVAQRLLEVIAVAGRPVDRVAAARVAGVADEPSVYHRLRTERLVRRREVEGRAEVEPYHDRIREAVAAGLSLELRRVYCAKLAEALDESGRADRETLAAYYAEGGDVARARSHMMEAAEEASRALAFERAAKLYGRVIAIGGAEGEALRELREKLGDALVNAGMGKDAAIALLAAVEGAPHDRAVVLRRRAAEQLLLSGHIAEALDELGAVLREVNLKLPRTALSALVRVLFMTVWLAIRGFGFRRREEAEVSAEAMERIETASAVSKGLALVDTPRAAYFSVLFLVMAIRAGEPRRVLRALAMFVSYGASMGGEEPPWLVRQAHGAARSLLQSVDDPYAGGMLTMAEGVSASLRGKHKEALARLREAGHLFRERCVGVAWEIDTVNQFAVSSLYWNGAWKELCDVLPALGSEARSRGDRFAETSHLLRAGHVPLLLRGAVKEVGELHQRLRAAWWPERFSLQHFFLMSGTAEQLLYAERGIGPSAYHHLEGLWGALEGSYLMLVQSIDIEISFLRIRAAAALVAPGNVDPAVRGRAIAVARGSLRRLRKHDIAWARALASLAKVTIAVMRGDREGAIRLFGETEGPLREAECPHYAAAAQRRRGELTGDEALLRAADEWFKAQGAAVPARIAAMLLPGAWG